MVEAFDAQQWVLRMGKELERVACDADPCFFPRNAPPPWGATKETDQGAREAAVPRPRLRGETR